MQLFLSKSYLKRSVVCLSFSKDNSNFLVAIDEGSDHTLTIWDYQQNGGNCKIAEAKCSNKETVVAAEFHPLDPGLILTCGKGHVNFWHFTPGKIREKVVIRYRAFHRYEVITETMLCQL